MYVHFNYIVIFDADKMQTCPLSSYPPPPPSAPLADKKVYLFFTFFIHIPMEQECSEMDNCVLPGTLNHRGMCTFGILFQDSIQN